MHISNNDTDEEIALKIQNTRDSSLFEVLYERHVYKVYNKCLGFASDAQTAEDLTHDVFLKAFINLKSYKGNAKFYTWLYSLTYNYCVDYYNSQKKNKENLEGYIQDEVSETTDNEPSDQRLFEIKLEQLKVVLEQIPADDKVILLMKYQDDFSIDDIAAALDLGISAVKMRVKRAKTKVLNTYNEIYNNKKSQII